LLPGWPLTVFLLLPVLVAALALIAALVFSAPSAAAAATPQPGVAPAAGAPPLGLPAATGLLVQVSGAVVKPGLYRVAKGDRVYAAIAAAGGLAADADPDKLPAMAARLKDGEQVKVPARKTPGAAARSSSATVDLNSATLDELESVPGISPELAAAALDYRTQFGGFASSRELVTVLGMSEADYLLVKKYVHI
jgi:competence protein ComEA